MRAEIYRERESNATNPWDRIAAYEKKWRYWWQGDREREMMEILGGWEREVKEAAEEQMCRRSIGDEPRWHYAVNNLSDPMLPSEFDLLGTQHSNDRISG